MTERETKSIGAEETFEADLHTRAACEREVLRLADRAMVRVRAAKYAARTITLKVRFGDFETKTRSRTIKEATELTALVAETARALLAEFDFARGIRLLGVSLSHFEPAGAVQQVLSLDTSATTRVQATRVQTTRVQTTWGTARAPCNASRSNVPATPCVPASATTRCDRPSSSITASDAEIMIRIGLVGCGHIGMVHSYALKQLVECGLVDAAVTATFDIDADRSVRAAAYHGATPMSSIEAVVDAVDAVWVCTWTAAHREAVECAAGAGRAIFCEKPLAPTYEECERVAAALATVPHQVGLVLRHAPVFALAAEHVASGRHGRPLATTLRDDQYFPIQGQYGSTWRKDVAAAGGGTLIEHSIHDVDIIRWLLGDPVTVAAHTANRFGHAGIDDIVAVTMAYADGSVAQLTSVWHQVLTRESSRRLEVFCEDALLWTEDDYLGPLHVQTAGGTDTIELRSARVGRPPPGARALRQGRGRLRRAQPAVPGRARVRRSRGGRPPVGRDRPRRPPDRGRRAYCVGGARRGPRAARDRRRVATGSLTVRPNL